MHVVFRLSGRPVRLFRDHGDSNGTTLGFAVACGARASYYVKEISDPICTVGAVLAPGACLPLFGAPAGELSGHHTSLDYLWVGEADSARTRLLDERNPSRRLDLLERMLAERLRGIRALHPAVAMALERFQAAAAIREVVSESGYSHRRFIELFHESVGLTPKLHCRVRRFVKALSRLGQEPQASLSGLAIAAGYSGQAHFSREFLEFAGVTPGEYRGIAPLYPHHVRLLQPPAG